MEVPITQFRKNIFALVNQAIEGREVWFTHKGRRLKVVPEGKPVNKLSRITPMDIIAPGVDLEDDSWKEEIMGEWEQSWDRQLASIANSSRKPSVPKRSIVRRKPAKA